MAAAIGEIDHEANNEPDHEPKPGYERQTEHEREAGSVLSEELVGIPISQAASEMIAKTPSRTTAKHRKS